MFFVIGVMVVLGALFVFAHYRDGQWNQISESRERAEILRHLREIERLTNQRGKEM
jgi:hypothetical protein